MNFAALSATPSITHRPPGWPTESRVTTKARARSSLAAVASMNWPARSIVFTTCSVPASSSACTSSTCRPLKLPTNA